MPYKYSQKQRNLRKSMMSLVSDLPLHILYQWLYNILRVGISPKRKRGGGAIGDSVSRLMLVFLFIKKAYICQTNTNTHFNLKNLLFKLFPSFELKFGELAKSYKANEMWAIF
jgi:hypothetical protein